MLSTDGSVKNYPTIQLGIPYSKNKALLDSMEKPAIQLIIDDPDKDDITDIYFNFDHSSASIPKTWKQKGIYTKYVIVSFAGGQLKYRKLLMV